MARQQIVPFIIKRSDIVADEKRLTNLFSKSNSRRCCEMRGKEGETNVGVHTEL